MTLGINIECRYADWRYAEPSGVFIFNLSVIMLSVIMLGVMAPA